MRSSKRAEDQSNEWDQTKGAGSSQSRPVQVMDMRYLYEELHDQVLSQEAQTVAYRWERLFRVIDLKTISNTIPLSSFLPSFQVKCPTPVPFAEKPSRSNNHITSICCITATRSHMSVQRVEEPSRSCRRFITTKGSIAERSPLNAKPVVSGKCNSVLAMLPN